MLMYRVVLALKSTVSSLSMPSCNSIAARCSCSNGGCEVGEWTAWESDGHSRAAPGGRADTQVTTSMTRGLVCSTILRILGPLLKASTVVEDTPPSC